MDIGIGNSKRASPMDNSNTPSIFSQSGSYLREANRKKREVEQMSIEELRINKKLLHEIAQKKKENSAQKSSAL